MRISLNDIAIFGIILTSTLLTISSASGQNYMIEDADSYLSSPVDKKASWNSIHGSWGKRLIIPEESVDVIDTVVPVEVMLADNEDPAILADDIIPLKRSWSSLHGSWGKRSSKSPPPKTTKPNWLGLRGSWGKRSRWGQLRGAWGKRKNSWSQLRGSWGKRNSQENNA